MLVSRMVFFSGTQSLQKKTERQRLMFLAAGVKSMSQHRTPFSSWLLYTFRSPCLLYVLGTTHVVSGDAPQPPLLSVTSRDALFFFKHLHSLLRVKRQLLFVADVPAIRSWPTLSCLLIMLPLESCASYFV